MEELDMEDSEWLFPLVASECNGIPVEDHAGAFGNKRKYGERHCGVDLYCKKYTRVHAVEAGTVVSIELFTGELVGCPWWNNTWAIRIAGESGIVVYGEIEVYPSIRVGDVVGRGIPIGIVIPVLPDSKKRPDIPGHSTSMLHFQWYKKGVLHKEHPWNREEDIPPDGVLDPTEMLKKSCRLYVPLLNSAGTKKINTVFANSLIG